MFYREFTRNRRPSESGKKLAVVSARPKFNLHQLEASGELSRSEWACSVLLHIAMVRNRSSERRCSRVELSSSTIFSLSSLVDNIICRSLRRVTIRINIDWARAYVRRNCGSLISSHAIIGPPALRSPKIYNVRRHESVWPPIPSAKLIDA